MKSPVRSRLLAALLATGVALLVSELTLRIALPPLGADQDAVHPMASWAQADAFAAYRAKPGHYLRRNKTVDDDGFLSSPDCPRPKPAGTLRIAFLGGSSTACTIPPVGDAATWPALAVAKLRERFPQQRIDFVNAALPGYSTFESYGRLWARVRFLEPDLVLVNHGWNELYYFRRTAERVSRWRTNPDGGWGFHEPPRYQFRDRHPVDAWLGGSQLAMRAARLLWPSGGGEVGSEAGAGELADDFDPEGPQVFGTNLELLLTAGEVLGCEVHVARQATLVVEGLAPELQERCGFTLHGFGHAAHVRAFEALYAEIAARVPAERVFDATSMSGDPRWFVDHVHLSVAGNERIAELVAEHLAPAIARRSAPAAAPR